MDDEENRRTMQRLISEIQDKAVQLSDLEIVIEDYERERRELLHQIGQLKASLWELSAESRLPEGTPRAHPTSSQSGDQPAA